MSEKKQICSFCGVEIDDVEVIGFALDDDRILCESCLNDDIYDNPHL